MDLTVEDREATDADYDVNDMAVADCGVFVTYREDGANRQMVAER